MLGQLVGGILGGGDKGVKLSGTVVLMKKNVLDFTDVAGNILDGVSDLLGQTVSFQLVSATVGDPNNGNRGVVGKEAYLEQTISLIPSLVAGESKFNVTFHWDHQNHGIPGAIIVKNKHLNQFFLKTLTLDDFPGKGSIHFVCNSWVYNVSSYTYDRIFFANDTYKPEDTPAPLKPYRQEELTHLRGDNVNRQLQEWDRIYGYAYYNDLGEPDLGNPRPILGGSEEYPYPRRGRTGRPPTLKDPNSESRILLLALEIYVPRDERFGHLKMSDFLGYSIKAVVQSLLPTLKAIIPWSANFNSYQDILNLYEGGLPLPDLPILSQISEKIPFEMVKSVVTANNGERILKFPKPRVIKDNKTAYATDEEFAREMLAGLNPVVISRLQEFPPTSKLDPKKYGNQTSSITAAHIEKNMNGLTVQQALSSNKLFILDHHDSLMPYINRINSTKDIRTYATRTLLFLNDDDTLKPVAIELSLPNPQGEQYGAISKVFTPSEVGIEGSLWLLAKAYVRVNDYGIHELISHWLNTHAVVEPFVISTNRHLSVLHPIYKLLQPHYRDTMNINALARQALINAGGIIEYTTFSDKYSMEMSSAVYKSWNFTEQALPADLIKRGLAVEDSASSHGIRLLIEDYPYAVDGLEIWSAIQTWVVEYCSIYYPSDAAVRSDVELQAWWKEIREVGHGDKKDDPWWPTMQTISDLTQICTTIIWTSSALHAAVNFGQFGYAGYLPNRPTITRELIPEPGSARYKELEANPEKALLNTITAQIQTLISMSTLEILSTHASDEVYLGQRDSSLWTSDQKALAAFKQFGEKLRKIEKDILERNKNPNLKNRNGPVKVPYTSLYATSKEGITEMGIPNSISI